MGGNHKVNVYHEGEVVARVNYNECLDQWDGHNFTCGSTGRHLGITRLKKPIDGMTFVLIHGTQWQGGKNSAELVSDEEAIQEMLRADKFKMVEKYFPERAASLDVEEVEI